MGMCEAGEILEFDCELLELADYKADFGSSMSTPSLIVIRSAPSGKSQVVASQCIIPLAAGPFCKKA